MRRVRGHYHNLTFGNVYVEVGSMRVKVGPFWVPEGLHIWVGSRGVHLYWSASPHVRRLTFDRCDD